MVSNKYEEFRTPEKFFSELGNEPAIRRAFRLWVEDNLTNDNHVNDLISSTLKNPNIEKYWADELMVAIFKSEDCSSFFNTFKNDLLENDGNFFRRCIHLIRTACKESNVIKEHTFLAPVGSGWKESLVFIKSNLNELQELRPLICKLLFDWQDRFLFQDGITDEEILNAKEIVISFIQQIEEGNEFWREKLAKYGWNRRTDTITDEAKLISLLYDIATVAQPEITHLINNALEFDDDKLDRGLRSFYKIVLDKCLSGIGTINLTKELPDLVIKVAWKIWKLKVPKHNLKGDLRTQRNVLSKDKCWGIIDNQSFYPSGIFKTPIYNLLQNKPTVGVKFIAEFLNYSIDFYVNSFCEYKREFKSIELELIDGTVVKKWAAWELWGAYRGDITVTHYLIESLLMSLEKYLLELVVIRTDISRAVFKHICNYILKNSNNVTTTSVLASIAMAYPEEITEDMLPIFSVKEFYHWDSTRVNQESSTSFPFDALSAHEKKYKDESNQLPHRKKYREGLKGFIIDYQLIIRKFNDEIHKIFDKMKSHLKDDILDKKTLTEIDMRNWEKREIKNHPGLVAFQVKYDKEVSNYIDSNKPHVEAHKTSINYWSIIHKAFEGEKPMTFEVWKECFSHYSTSPIDVTYDMPVTLSVLGLQNFNDNLNSEQKEWCIKMLQDAVIAIVQHRRNGQFHLPSGFNIMEQNTALSSFHFLMDNAKNEEDEDKVALAIINTISAPFDYNEINKILYYFRKTFFSIYPSKIKSIWTGLIKFAEFKSQNPYHYYDSNAEEAKAKEDKFLSEINLTDTIPIESIDLEKHRAYYVILNAFLILPFNHKDETLREFQRRFISVFVERISEPENHSHSDYIAKLLVRDYLTGLLLYCDFEFSRQILDILLTPIYAEDFSFDTRGQLYEFTFEVVKFVINQLDTGIANTKDENLKTELIDSFWKIWSHIFQKNKNEKKLHFASLLLLDIEWKLEYTDWKPLEEGKDFYYEMVKELGWISPESIVKLFSTVGDKVFLPHGISWLVTILKENPHQLKVLLSESSERLVKRLFYNHISEIKNSQQLVNDFIWLLDRMVDLGSSEAYLFRENVITYKKGITMVS